MLEGPSTPQPIKVILFKLSYGTKSCLNFSFLKQSLLKPSCHSPQPLWGIPCKFNLVDTVLPSNSKSLTGLPNLPMEPLGFLLLVGLLCKPLSLVIRCASHDWGIPCALSVNSATSLLSTVSWSAKPKGRAHINTPIRATGWKEVVLYAGRNK